MFKQTRIESRWATVHLGDTHNGQSIINGNSRRLFIPYAVLTMLPSGGSELWPLFGYEIIEGNRQVEKKIQAAAFIFMADSGLVDRSTENVSSTKTNYMARLTDEGWKYYERLKAAMNQGKSLNSSAASLFMDPKPVDTSPMRRFSFIMQE